jgi:hypothetical protein
VADQRQPARRLIYLKPHLFEAVLSGADKRILARLSAANAAPALGHFCVMFL